MHLARPLSMRTFAALLMLSAFFGSAQIFASPHQDLRLADAFYRQKAYRLAAMTYRGAAESGADAFGVREDAAFGEALSLQRAGHFAAAALAYERLLSGAPAGERAASAWLGLALCQEALGDTAEAERALLRADSRGLSPAQQEQADLVKAEILYASSRYMDAEEAYRLFRDKHPGFERPDYLLYARAWCFVGLAQAPRRAARPDLGAQDERAQQYEQAMGLFAQAASEAPKGELAPLALFQQAECRFGQGRFDDAKVLYQEFEKKYDGHEQAPAARYSIAWCAFSKERWKEAGDAFHKFAVVHESHELAPWGYYLTGLSLSRAKELDLAQSAYEITIKKYSGSEPARRARYGLAWLASARQDWQAAYQAYDQYLKIHGDTDQAPQALFLRADSLYRLDRYGVAREDYLSLLRRFPESSLAEDALFFAGACSLAQGENKRAREEFQQFRRQRPESVRVPEALLREGDALFAEASWADAGKAYLKALKQGKGEVAAGARSGLGWVAFRQGRFNESLTHFQKLTADSQTPAAMLLDARLRSGDSLYNLKRYEDALAEYRLAGQAAQASNPLAVDAHYQAGWAAYRLKDFDQAQIEWGKALALAPSGERAPECRYWSAWALFRKGSFDLAATLFAEVLEKHSGSHLAGEAQLRQADSLYNAGKYEEALPLYQNVVAKYPKEAKAAAALTGVQWCNYALGRDEQAVSAAKDFIKANPASEAAPEVQYRVAEHYVQRGDFASAERELDALKSNYAQSKFDLEATYWRGLSRLKNLKLNEAVQDFKGVVQKAPGHKLAPKAQFKLGMAYYRMQEYAQALEAFHHTLDAYGNTPEVAADAQFNLGMTYKRLQKNDDAIKAYDELVARWPESSMAPMARIRVGYIHEDNRDYDKAIAAYQKLAASDPGKLGAEAQYLVGDCYLAQKKSGEALLAYQAVSERFVNEGAWVVTALAKVGELEESLGHDAKALAAYQRIIELGGDPTWVASARKRIELIKAKAAQKKKGKL